MITKDSNPTNVSGSAVPEKLHTAFELAEAKGIPTGEALRQIETAEAPAEVVPESERKARELRDRIAREQSKLDQLDAKTRDTQQQLAIHRKRRDTMAERLLLATQQRELINPEATLDEVIGDRSALPEVRQLISAVASVENARRAAAVLDQWIANAIPKLAQLQKDHDDFAQAHGLNIATAEPAVVE